MRRRWWTSTPPPSKCPTRASRSSNPSPAPKTSSFAINTSYDVFLVSKKYYCCYQGVWFEAPAAAGAWVVCDKVPGPIYTIPPESPKHNVTYVNVYESTPTTVQVGTTDGYSGSYVANGLVVFGLGMWLGHEMAENNYWHGHYYPNPCWYGYSTVAGVQTSKGGAGVGVDHKYGSDAMVGTTASGDVYVSKDGNMYKDESSAGGWQKRENSGWQSAPDTPVATPNGSKSGAQARPNQPAAMSAQPATRPAKQTTLPSEPANRPTQPTTRPAPSGSNLDGYSNRQSTPSQLNRDSCSRERSGGGGGGGGSRERSGRR